ncbi:MAG: class I SAM-dependent methyltransferase [Steroidobacteraceae bacterium]
MAEASGKRPHELFPERTAGEVARQAFLVEFKKALVHDLRPRIREDFLAAGGKPDDADVRAAALVASLPSHRWYSALARAQHELYVDSTAECVERQAVALRDRARAVRNAARHGTLHLDPSLVPPSYQSAVDIHCVPGGYNLELMPDDVYAAARYELGITLYTLGQHGALNDSKGQAGVAFLQTRFPQLDPRSIVDLGCTVGNSTLPYVDAFPAATVTGIDVSAPALRYAHARSELLGRAVHFRQANAEKLPWADGSVDVVVSHILMHETSRRGLARIFTECHRVLRCGGVMLHVDVPAGRGDADAFDRAMADWETDNNNEPFWRGLHALDLPHMAVEAGFDAASVFDECFDAGHVAFINGRPWWMFGARKECP